MAYDPAAAKSGAVYSDVPNYTASWICYINGIEVPIIGFNISYGVWQIPEFTIDLIPDPLLIRLGNEDRVPVQIFYLDYWADPEFPEFRLLIDGEIIGWSYVNAESSRVLRFKCITFIHLFKQLFFYYMTNVDDIVAAQSPDVQSQGFTQAGLLYPYSLFHQGLLVPPGVGRQTTTGAGNNAQRSIDVEGVDDPNTNNDAPIQVPYQFVYNVIKGIISSDIPANRKSLPMLNFFARHTRKTRFHNRWVRLPILEDPEAVANQTGVFPIFKAARADEALNAMQRHLSSQIGNNGPVWETIEMVLKHVHMELAMIPNPACFTVQLLPAENIEQDGKILGLLQDNTPVSDQLSTESRATVVMGLVERLTDLIEGRGDTANQATLLQDAGLTELPRSVNDIDPIAIATNIANRERRIGVAPQQPVRLGQYFVKPEFMFGIPPHCNVIFPSMFHSFSNDESYINQPTRTYVNDSVMTRLLRASGPSREFMLHALSVAYPEEANAILHHKVGSSAQGESTSPNAGKESGKNLIIWPEEVFKGIVTSKMEIPAWFQMLQQFSNAAPNPDDASNPVTPPGNFSSDVTPTSNITIIPSAGTPRPTTNISYASGTNPVSGGAGTRIEGNREIFQSGPTVARRIVVGRETLVTIKGRSEERFWVLRGGGLDPRYYRDPAKTLLYPFEVNGVPNNVRGRTNRTSGPSLSIYQKLALMVKFIMPYVRERINGLSDTQLLAVTFGFCWIILNEGGVNNVMYNWAFGNQKAYNTFPVKIWSINPGDKIPYVGGETAEEGARNFVEELLASHARSLGILLGNNKGPAELEAFLNENVNASFTQFWRQNGGGVRPDYFYIALGYNGYYAQESDPLNPGGNNNIRRATIGLNRTLGTQRSGLISNYFTRIQALIPQVNPVPTARPVTHTPFISQEDYNYVLNQPRTAHVYRRESNAATIRTISRTVRTTTGIPSANTALPNSSTTNPAPTVTSTPNNQNNNSDPSESTDNSTNQFSELFKLYAQYAYLRERYSQRQTAVVMAFNPYLVPGFPLVIFDAIPTSFHTVGYVAAISHTGNAAGQLTTTVSSIANRTFYEFLNDVRNDIERFSARIIAAPAEIIDSIRNVIQDETQAEAFYQRLFYGGPRRLGIPASFNFLNAVGYARGIDTEEIEITGEPLSQIENQHQDEQPLPATTTSSANVGGVSSQGQRTVTHNIDPNLELSPKDNIYSDAFNNYHIAMQLCSRPVCSLKDYARFWHGGRTLNDLIAEGLVGDERTEFSYAKQKVEDVLYSEPDSLTGTQQLTRGTTERKPAVYYSRIFKLRPGPGREPTDNEQGFISRDQNIRPVVPNAGLPADYPETRANWDTVLIEYANKVRLLLRPNR